MAYGVIGNTTVSGTVILGSSPGRPAEFPGSSRRVTEGAHRSSAPRSSSGLGHRPLTAAARVQIPYGVQREDLHLVGGVFFFVGVGGGLGVSGGGFAVGFGGRGFVAGASRRSEVGFGLIGQPIWQPARGGSPLGARKRPGLAWGARKRPGLAWGALDCPK